MVNNLRLGDFVRNKNGDICQVRSIEGQFAKYVSLDNYASNDGTLEDGTDDDINGVTLTPEILLKNGFKTDKHRYPYPTFLLENKEQKYQIIIAFPRGDKTQYKKPWVEIDGETVFVGHLEVEYVHELQIILDLAKVNIRIVPIDIHHT